MRHHGRTTLALIGALAWACASPPATDSDKINPALSKYVLSAVPADVPNPTFVDFGGKVHLVGWEVSPTGVVSPGSSISLKLYWRSVGRVAQGYHLATRLTAANGKVYTFDDTGPLRAGARLPPSAWVPGMVYVDEQTLVVPEDVETNQLALSVGVVNELFEQGDGGLEKVGDFGLEVLSGVSDGKQSAVLARFTIPSREKGSRGRPGGGKRPGMQRRPGAPPGQPPFGRLGMEKEKAP